MLLGLRRVPTPCLLSFTLVSIWRLSVPLCAVTVFETFFRCPHRQHRWASRLNANPPCSSSVRPVDLSTRVRLGSLQFAGTSQRAFREVVASEGWYFGIHPALVLDPVSASAKSACAVPHQPRVAPGFFSVNSRHCSCSGE